jgi:hypothetical protein
LALAYSHPHTLAFNQSTQSGACECRGMNEDVLSPAILPNETEPLVGFVEFHGPNAFRDRTFNPRRSGPGALR